MTDVAETPVPADAGSDSGPRRGRPRPEATIQRDEMVLAHVSESGMTRDELVSALEAAGQSLGKNQVYLSLYRLRTAGKVERVRDGGAHKWRRPSPTD